MIIESRLTADRRRALRDQLTKIEVLLAGAQPGPWEVDEYKEFLRTSFYVKTVPGRLVMQTGSVGDARLIAASYGLLQSHAALLRELLGLAA